MKSRPRLRAVLAAGAVCALAVTGISACSRGPAQTLGAGPIAPNAVTGTKPPPLTVLTRDTSGASGDIFIAPAGGGYPAGPEILTTTGKVVWFHRLPAGDVATDFRTQTYLGQPVLTWFQSGGQGARWRPRRRSGEPVGPSGPSGTDYIYNDHYRQIATVRAANGDATNFHEFLITPWNTALIRPSTVTTANLTSIGGPAEPAGHRRPRPGDRHQDRPGAVPVGQRQPRPLRGQLRAAAVLPEHALGLVPHQRRPPRHRRQPAGGLPEYLDRVQGGPAHRPGHVAARRQAQFLRPARRPRPGLDRDGKIFAWQHDPEAIGGGEYTFFDDESGGSLLGSSRVVTVRLDLATRVATLVKSVDQPEGQVAQVMGNAQTTPGGGLFVGWGSLPYISEFSPSGKLLFNAKLPAGSQHVPRLPAALAPG